MTRSQHVHTWGCRTRPPRTGDLCLACPQTWRRGISGYLTDGYKPRTVPHAAARIDTEDAT